MVHVFIQREGGDYQLAVARESVALRAVARISAKQNSYTPDEFPEIKGALDVVSLKQPKKLQSFLWAPQIK